MVLFLDCRLKDNFVQNKNEFQKLVRRWLISDFCPVEAVVYTIAKDLETEEPATKKPRSLLARQNFQAQEFQNIPTNCWAQNFDCVTLF